MNNLLLFFLICAFPLFSTQVEDRKTLFNRLDPHSLSEHLSFYKLYPNTTEGQKALEEAWNLLFATKPSHSHPLPHLKMDQKHLNSLINLSDPNLDSIELTLKPEDLELIEYFSHSLSNRNLEGYHATTIDEILSLPPKEIDLSKALLLTTSTPEAQNKYLAILDLMALQIRAHLPPSPTPEQIITAINTLIFEKFNYQFPPHAQWVESVDIYTFLPSVMDSRKGVCLGISTLYICLAQRLNIHLQMITPPGHIYVRYSSLEETINIETTARGIHIPSDEYLSLNTKKLQIRNEKEVIGLTFFNQASVYLQNREYDQAIIAYKKAQTFLPTDPLVDEYLAFAYILQGETEQGKALLTNKKKNENLVYPSTLVEDYLHGKVDAEGINTLFQPINNTRKSLLEKKRSLEKVLKSYPDFREGIFQYALIWLQLGRKKEAIKQLERYHSLDPHNPTTEYYLAFLYLKRFNYNKAWTHFLQAEAIGKEANHVPRTLKVLKKELLLRSPP